jgi:hypothetical protein
MKDFGSGVIRADVIVGSDKIFPFAFPEKEPAKIQLAGVVSSDVFPG